MNPLNSVHRDDLPLADEYWWQDFAACLGIDPDLFFPARGEDSAPAKEVCATCAVRVQCLEYALTNHLNNGVWGGMSEIQRKRLRAARNRAGAV